MPSNPPDTTSAWRDTPERYGRISRILHWSMALLLLWLFTGMILKNALGLHPRDSWIVGSHASFGVIAWCLMLVRGAWALANLHRRPSYGEGRVARLASLGHLGLYVLMFLVPTLGLLRQFGSGRAFALFNTIPVFGAGEPVQGLVDAVNATRDAIGFSVHGLLAWTMLALIVGHLVMVVVHHVVWKDGTLRRMVGASRAA